MGRYEVSEFIICGFDGRPEGKTLPNHEIRLRSRCMSDNMGNPSES